MTRETMSVKYDSERTPGVNRNGLVLRLTTDSSAYAPGTTVTCLLEVSPLGQDEEICMKEIKIDFCGLERVDTSWVSKEYRETIAAVNADVRRVQREVIRSKLRASTQGDFREEHTRVFLVRCTLPSWLPPSFKGIIVRYAYYLDVHLSYTYMEAENHVVEDSESIRKVLHVWPKESFAVLGESDDDDEVEDGSNSASIFCDQEIGNVESPSIKCWEVGAGTMIDDAIHHVDSLDLESKSSTPYSPGSRYLSRTVSLESERKETKVSVPTSSNIAEALRKKQVGLISVIPEKGGPDAIEKEVSPSQELVSVFQTQPKYFDGSTGVSSFRLRMNDAVLVTLHLHPSCMLMEQLTPGSSIAGTLEFVDGEHEIFRCHKYTVALEFEERIRKRWRNPRRSSAILGSVHETVDETVQLTADTLSTFFMFSIPIDATPNFSTNLLSLNWGLRFHFFASKPDGGDPQELEWYIPLKISVPH